MKKLMLVMLLAMTSYVVSSAQDRQITGQVSDESGEPLIGATILVQGSTSGAATDVEGKYTITVPEGFDVLIFSYTGFAVQEVTLGVSDVLDVQLQADAAILDEIVVTAIGIERESKSLGYAVSVVDGDDITRARAPNLVNSLSGKVAGVQITNTSGSIGGGSRIVVRGQATLGAGGSAVNNQPLFVIDGVPIFNTNFAAGSNGSDGDSRIQGNVNTGNAAGDINPDDIESISVLKGGAAAALYGQRAKDGVIIITTKKGNKYRGAEVSVNSSVRFDRPLVLPDFQNEYAQGDFGKYLLDSRGRPQNLNGWGPRIEGQMAPDFRGEMVPLQAYPDNVQDFYETGLTLINSLSFQDANETGDFRLSLSNTRQQGIVPESSLTRYNVGINTGRKINDRLSTRISANYINNRTDGISVQGGNDVNVLSSLINGLPRTTNIEDVKTFVDPATGFQVPLNENSNNPFWIINRNLTSLSSDRVFGNIQLDYKFADWLTFTARQGLDYLVFDLERINAPGTIGITTNGSIRVERRQQTQLNTDAFLNISPNLGGNFSFNGIIGYNFNQLTTERLRNLASDLQVDNVFTFGNANANSLTRRFIRRRLIGAFGDITLGYKDWLYLNLTARNDWSSTLPKDNNSFFYPSANLSFVLTDALNLENSFLDYAKIRASYAEVGSDEAAYQLDFRAFPVTTFFGQLGTSNQFPFGGQSGFEVTATIPPLSLMPQTQATYEFGAELQFLNSRLALDFNYYNAETRDQILSLLIPASTGFRRLRTNAGTIRNEGVEILLSGIPFKSKNFSWQLSANFTRNVNTVTELAEGVDEIRMESGFNDGVLIARKDETIKFFGNGFDRDPDGNVIIDPNTGLRQESNNIDLGQVAPEWMLGLTNSFSYKGVHLSFLLDIRKGGLIISNTVGLLRRSGLAAETVINREGTFVDQGVIVTERDADGNITATRPNDVPVASMQEWWQNTFSSRNAEAVAFDASFVKLREIRLGYSLPQSLIQGSPFKRASISLEARDLFLFYSEVPDIDPETKTTGPADNFDGYEWNNVPSTRSLGFNINLTF